MICISRFKLSLTSSGHEQKMAETHPVSAGMAMTETENGRIRIMISGTPSKTLNIAVGTQLDHPERNNGSRKSQSPKWKRNRVTPDRIVTNTIARECLNITSSSDVKVYFIYVSLCFARKNQNKT